MKKQFTVISGTEKPPVNPDSLSPLARTIHSAFESNKQWGNSTLFVFWEAWGDYLHCRGVPAGHYPWDEHDNMKAVTPYASLCFAFDLHRPFEEQFDVESMGQMTTLESFAQRPVVWITDRAGRIPAEENRRFYKNALKPDIQIIK